MTDVVQLHSTDCTSNNQPCCKIPWLFCEPSFNILHPVECVYWLDYFNLYSDAKASRPTPKEREWRCSFQKPVTTTRKNRFFFKMANFQSCITMPQPLSHKATWHVFFFFPHCFRVLPFTNRLTPAASVVMQPPCLHWANAVRLILSFRGDGMLLDH